MQTVAAQHDRVVRVELERTAGVDFNLGFEPDTARNHVAAGAEACLLRRQRTPPDLLLDPRVVVRQALNPVWSDQIGAAISNVGPPQMPVLVDHYRPQRSCGWPRIFLRGTGLAM